MKQSKTDMKKQISMMHWAARLMIKYGTLASLSVLLFGFAAERGSFMAGAFCRTAVAMFALSIVGGLLSDVVAQRKGMRE